MVVPRLAVVRTAGAPRSSYIAVAAWPALSWRMTKAENRAAAKAYHRQKLKEMADQIRAERIDADLVELGRLRHYLIFGSQTAVAREPLLTAIDDYVEALTGDRGKLQARPHSAGCKHT
jgi:hypothetical protein